LWQIVQICEKNFHQYYAYKTMFTVYPYEDYVISFDELE